MSTFGSRSLITTIMVEVMKAWIAGVQRNLDNHILRQAEVTTGV